MPCVEITPDDFDDMHHALGRPDLAKLQAGQHYRNYYATEAGSPWARRAETLGMWDRITREGERIVTYRLNADGKSVLADWLRLRESIPAESRVSVAALKQSEEACASAPVVDEHYSSNPQKEGQP